MNNVESIHGRRSKPAIPSQGPLAAFDPIFFLGVAAYLVAPHVAAGFYFGVLFAAILGVCALIGTGFGLSLYRRLPYRVVSVVPSEERCTESGKEINFRLAA